MIGKKFLTLTLATTVILSACGQSKESLEAFYKKVEKANQEEKVIVDLNEKMAKAEKEKVKKIEELNKAKDGEFKSKAQEITNDIKNREKIINDEKEAMDKSKKIYESSKNDYKAIEDEEQSKEAADLKKALDEKYKVHDKVIKGYKEVLNTEEKLFSYLSDDNATQEGANDRSKKLAEVNKKTEKVVTEYQNNLKKVQQEKKDVSAILNE
ncbi:YkyA family protein [Mammaliicoccus vitulinus]|uniref:YkyA family protein n=1 Tax=Mammaliicoccus vitulinus TaxID=71237 RepID=UPI002DB67464|nr:YkyA family protein [Mammaliicoccus vitulinus]MEB7656377.1 YkyA family protein [Mammaliicoccus vitulinus]